MLRKSGKETESHLIPAGFCKCIELNRKTENTEDLIMQLYRVLRSRTARLVVNSNLNSNISRFQRVLPVARPGCTVKSAVANYCSQSKPTEDISTVKHSNNITPEMISHLERTSLVGFGSEEAVSRLEEAIKFADVLFEVDTTGVEPMDSVLENETLFLREDGPKETSREDVTCNAAIIDEDYFVAPPGNIPLDANQLSPDLTHKAKSS